MTITHIGAKSAAAEDGGDPILSVYSWKGHTLKGDEASIDALRAALDAAEELPELRAENDRLKALLSDEQRLALVKARGGLVTAESR